MITFKEYVKAVNEAFDADEFARHMAKLRADSKKTGMEKLVAGLHADDAHKDKMKKMHDRARSTSLSDPVDTHDTYSAYSANSIYKHN